MLRTLREAVRLTAPLLGVYLYTTFGSHFFVWFVCLALIISAGLFLNLEVDNNHCCQQTHISAFSFYGLMEGAKGLWRIPLIHSCVLCLSVTLLVAGFYEVILFSILEHLNRPLSVIGQLISAQGIGAVFGGILSIRLIKKTPPELLILGGFVIQALGIAGLFSSEMPLIYLSCALFGFGVPPSMVGLDTLIQTKLPASIQGRVNTSLEAMTSIPFSLSFLISSLMITAVSYRVMLGYMVVVTVLAAVLLTFAVRNASSSRS